MFQKTAKIFLFLSVFFFFGHSFTAHAHAENEEPFLLHEHQDARDFFSCLFSIDLGENHLSVYSGENPQVFDFSGFIPFIDDCNGLLLMPAPPLAGTHSVQD